ncbi:hypothetical protein DdX_14630 [Ditylenchus destructor]|uniref:Uncharacterized protein n=1 Tax=Ditylenchus destructor TaxID=166010 RepID=A0AAD4MWR8_9BILA|nr:hypothetical protein DdX_14630 [Ditylenchus destructor]
MSRNVRILLLFITILFVDGATPPQLLVKLFVENEQAGQETISFEEGTNVEIAAKAVDNQIWKKQPKLKLFRASYHYEAIPPYIYRKKGVRTIYDPLAEIKAESYATHLLYVELVKDNEATGRRPKDKPKNYKDADKRILKILQEYQRNERTVIELLRGIAQNIVIDDVVGIGDEVENNE